MRVGFVRLAAFALSLLLSVCDAAAENRLVRDMNTLISAAKTLRSGGWSEKIPNERKLGEQYLNYQQELRDIADGIRFADQPGWASKMLADYQSRRLKNMNNVSSKLMQEILEYRKNLIEFSGRGVVERLERNLPRKLIYKRDQLISDLQ